MKYSTLYTILTNNLILREHLKQYYVHGTSTKGNLPSTFQTKLRPHWHECSVKLKELTFCFSSGLLVLHTSLGLQEETR